MSISTRSRVLTLSMAIALVGSACGASSETPPPSAEPDATSTSEASAQPTGVTPTGPQVDPTDPLFGTPPPLFGTPEPTLAVPQGSMTVRPLYVSGETGGTGIQVVRVEPSTDGTLRIDFSETEVGGFGDMIRAASWNAVAVATFLTGHPVAGRYTFELTGNVDGPSAGALTTSALLALFRGESILPGITMTGTINPTGTVGTVGGIPEKIRGAAEVGDIHTVLIPAGQRNTENAKGELVDVVRLGESLGVEVVEVADIYTAYQLLTGSQLPHPRSAPDPRVDNRMYDKLEAQTNAALARFDRAMAQMAGLDASLVSSVAPQVQEAQSYGTRARDLQRQAVQGAAFVTAQQAAMFAEALYNTLDTTQDVLVRGDVSVLDARLAASGTVQQELFAFLDQLSTYSPNTLSDVEGLITAYGNSFDALSLVIFGHNAIQAVRQKLEQNAYTDASQLFEDLFTPLIYYEIGRAQIQFSRAAFELGRDNGGAPITESAQLAEIAGFFRRAADANFAAFTSGVIGTNAQRQGVSNDVFLGFLANADLDVALAATSRNMLEAIQAYIGSDKPNAEFAQLGFAYIHYARTANLLEKYYNNGILDENLQLVGVRVESTLTRAIDLGRQQVAAGVGVLRAHDSDPSLSVANFEVAGISREGDLSDKFNTIAQYTSSFITSRILAYLGGFPADGFSQ